MISPKKLRRGKKYPDLNHDLIFYCCHNPMSMPEGKDIV